ncbi:MAG TPA: sulfur carrier protein ThiS [Aquifex aeolicus]|nr:sulfur carrier protein ThiS [Aquifex aeolicus]
MPKIILNGEEREIPREMTVMELLEEIGIKFREIGLAVAINEEVVPKSEYTTRKVKEGDKVEVVQLVGGG